MNSMTCNAESSNELHIDGMVRACSPPPGHSDDRELLSIFQGSPRPNRATTPTMSAQIPLRIARSPAHPLRRQCLFQRPIAPSTPRCIAATAARAFSSTPARLRTKSERLVDMRMQVAIVEHGLAGRPSPDLREKKGSDSDQDMAEDIGILQGTIIRAPFSKLPWPTSWEFYSYFWTLVKSKFTALYTRAHFKRCMQKKGVASYLPVDFLKQRELKNKAKELYKQYYEGLTSYVCLRRSRTNAVAIYTNQSPVPIPTSSKTFASVPSLPLRAGRSAPELPRKWRGNF